MERKIKIPYITFLLILLNVLFFLYLEFSGGTEDTLYMIKMGALSEQELVEGHEYYRLVTHFFMHFGYNHLFNNMLSLLVLGYSLEYAIGKWRFSLIYFLSGILAGLGSIVYNIYVTGEPTVSCGASGAIFGLMGALLVVLIKEGISRKSTVLPRYLVYLALSLYSGFSDKSIDNAAHVGGFVAGVVVSFLIINKKILRSGNYQ